MNPTETYINMHIFPGTTTTSERLHILPVILQGCSNCLLLLMILCVCFVIALVAGYCARIVKSGLKRGCKHLPHIHTYVLSGALERMKRLQVCLKDGSEKTGTQESPHTSLFRYTTAGTNKTNRKQANNHNNNNNNIYK